MNGVPALLPSDRVLMLAPHPDDETLGAGIALQQANAVGAAVQVVFATSGEANPWPQRWIERRWRLDAGDRKRWGERRSEEARQALLRLGIDPAVAIFLGWPDGGIDQLLLTDGDRLIEQLAALCSDFRPTRVILPSIRDHHPDHWALHLIARAALLGQGELAEPLLLEFLLHARRHARAELRVGQAASDAMLSASKLAALESHATQLRLNRGWLQNRAQAPEVLTHAMPATGATTAEQARNAAISIVSANHDGTRLRLDASHPSARRSRLGILIAGVSPRRVDTWRCAIDHDAQRICLTDHSNGALLGHVDYLRDAAGVQLELPRNLPGRLHYARFDRPRWSLQVVDRDPWQML